MTEQVDFEAFRTSWLQDVQQDAPSTVELGRRFALKIISQWLDASASTADLVYCDGSGDGGIDVAFLDEGPDSASDAPEESGHAWYLVQSKYGSAFAGIGTLLTEGQKVIETLDGRRPRLNSLAEGLLERLTNFRNAAGPADKLILVFATERALNDAERRALSDLRVLGRERLGPMFDVEAISIETIHTRLADEASGESALTLSLSGNLVDSGNGLLVGSVPFPNCMTSSAATANRPAILTNCMRRTSGVFWAVVAASTAACRRRCERHPRSSGCITMA